MSETGGEGIQVKLGRATVTVPIYINEHETRRIADLVSRVLQEIEDRSTRIDSQVFALQAAFQFAVECDKTNASVHTDAKEIAIALEDIDRRLRSILKTLRDL